MEQDYIIATASTCDLTREYLEEHKIPFISYSYIMDDKDHSDAEDRFRILGMSIENNLLIVVHCIREERIIRIISSRKATASETKNYERNLYL